MILNYGNNVLNFSNRVVDFKSTTTQPYTLLGTIASYLRNYMSDFRNPNFNVYRLDGTTPYEILDGGSDMYDGGNITTPVLRNGNTGFSISNQAYTRTLYPFAINYSASTRIWVEDTDNYYVSLGYIPFTGGTQNSQFHPLTVIGARSFTGTPIGWQVAGNSGADGSGLLASGIIYSGDNLSGFTTYAFFREQYNATDPSHCSLVILLGHANWGSSFGNIVSFAQPVSAGGCGTLFGSTGSTTSNLLSINTLLSKAGGVLVTSGECQTVVQSFVVRIKQALNY